MLDPREIDIEIARLEYAESSYPNYAKLADLYTIKNQMNQLNQQEPHNTNVYDNGYSYAARQEIDEYGDSPFLSAIRGKDPAKVWVIMDGLMDTLSVVNTRVYDGIMRKINAI